MGAAGVDKWLYPTDRGLFCEPGGFFVDPARAVDRAIITHGHSDHIGDLVVAREARGRGVGTVLLAAAERWARARGYRLITLNVFLDNVDARSVYEKAGYAPETIRPVKVLA